MTTTDLKPSRIGAVIDFERTIERFSRAVLDGDTEFVVAMTALVENMIGES